MTPRELFEALAAMKPADKAEVVERLAPDIVGVWPGIEKTAGRLRWLRLHREDQDSGLGSRGLPASGMDRGEASRELSDASGG